MTALQPPNNRFATYGTLSPGKPNHWKMKNFKGRWIEGTVRGRLHKAGWGAELGFPAIRLPAEVEVIAVKSKSSSGVTDIAGGDTISEERKGDEEDKVPVWILESDDLDEKFWKEMDEFEGGEYVRVQVAVETEEGKMRAWIYAIRD